MRKRERQCACITMWHVPHADFIFSIADWLRRRALAVMHSIRPIQRSKIANLVWHVPHEIQIEICTLTPVRVSASCAGFRFSGCQMNKNGGYCSRGQTGYVAHLCEVPGRGAFEAFDHFV